VRCAQGEGRFKFKCRFKFKGKGNAVGVAYPLLIESAGVRALPVRDNTHRVAGPL
jgi:hypothetical protein